MKSNRLLVVALAALVGGNSLRAQGPPAASNVGEGFAGRSEGNGTLRLLLGRPRPFHVESYGFARGDGAFQLDQTVAIQGRPPLNRTWVMTPAGPGQFTATLTDAAGLVTGHAEGNRRFLRYRYKGPLVVHQTLETMPDGRTIDNVGRITLLGIPVGSLRETIVHKD